MIELIKKPQFLVHLSGVLFATIFGFSFMFSKVALQYISPIGLISYRFAIAFVVFEILRRFKLVTIRFSKHHIKAILLVVILQPILYFLFEVNGLQRTSSSEAGMMIALIPIFASILGAILLKEKPTLIQIFFIVLSVSGIILIQIFKSTSGIQFESLGFFLLFGAVISAALFNIASRNASKQLKAYELTYFMMMIGAITFNSIYIVSLIITGSLEQYALNLLNPSLIFPLIYLGIIASIVAFFLVNFTLSRLEAHVSSIYANLATIVAITAGAVFLDETLYYYHFIGSAMIIIGVYGTVSLGRGLKRLK
jgi:drug/metabolite transporter (DMT)-like permease